MNDYGDMMKGFDQFNAEAGAYSGDGSAIRIEAACMQGGGSVEMEIHPYDTKESVCDVMVKALGLEALQKSGRFRPCFTKMRDEKNPG